MAKSVINITPRDWEVLSLVREIPYINTEIVQKWFFKSNGNASYAQKKISLFVKNGYLKEHKFYALKSVYSITSDGLAYLRSVVPNIRNKYYTPEKDIEFVRSRRVSNALIPHTLKLIDFKMGLEREGFFDKVLFFDVVEGKNSITPYRPDLILFKNDFRIYLEYEATKKSPKTVFEKFTHFYSEMPKPLVLVLYYSDDTVITERLLRYMQEFRQGNKGSSLKFNNEQIKKSERFYFGDGETFKNCIDKEINIDIIKERLLK